MSATSEPDPDEVLMAWIADAEGSTPDWVTNLGTAAWAWRDPDAALADLLADSALDATGARSSVAERRSVAYRLADLDVELLLTPGAATVAVELAVVGGDLRTVPSSWTIVVRDDSGVTTEQEMRTTADGGASATVPDGARMHLRVEVDGRRWSTPWLTL